MGNREIFATNAAECIVAFVGISIGFVLSFVKGITLDGVKE